MTFKDSLHPEDRSAAYKKIRLERLSKITIDPEWGKRPNIQQGKL